MSGETARSPSRCPTVSCSTPDYKCRGKPSGKSTLSKIKKRQVHLSSEQVRQTFSGKVLFRKQILKAAIFMVSLTLSIMSGARTIAVIVPYISTSDFTVQNCTLLSIEKIKSKKKMTESACIRIFANVQNRTTLIRRDEVDFKGACFSNCSLTINRLWKKTLRWFQIFLKVWN